MLFAGQVIGTTGHPSIPVTAPLAGFSGIGSGAILALPRFLWVCMRKALGSMKTSDRVTSGKAQLERMTTP
jgi:hypothetical protein